MTEDYSDVQDEELTIVLNATWTPVSSVSQMARIESGRDVYVLYVNSRIRRGFLHKNGEMIKIWVSPNVDSLKGSLEDYVIATNGL